MPHPSRFYTILHHHTEEEITGYPGFDGPVANSLNVDVSGVDGSGVDGSKVDSPGVNVP